ncbi:MAG TPA: hypothetical protein PLD20_24975 [Blastocatellia bacterium]|nr:hypothetical protein [Blastocatellia bacterium]HMV87592.1 hypothetical protein [Blastocatellia bacterium]HMX28760.1 hypothetical protein [Blastocatellia bacterium]HMY74379.1 hypothetical protein [Blastocatellia bacterium]HMZ21212.1 hypothetical protein [Blastocatellia bacterium]
MKSTRIILFTSLLIGVVCLPWVAAQQPQKLSTIEELTKEADAAYQHREYTQSVELYQEAIAKGARDTDTFYNAACSAALAGDRNSAFQFLDKAFAAGFHNTDHLKRDPDLTSLRDDSRWTKAIAASEAQQAKYIEDHSDPNKIRFITEDIARFWQAYDQAIAAQPEERAAIFQRLYIDPGTVGLKDFKQSGRLDATKLAKTVEHSQKFFAAIRPVTLTLGKQRAETVAAFRRFKTFYPEAIFSDAYFVIGQLQSGGTASKNGLLMGAEMFTRSTNVPMDGLSDWLKNGLMEPTEIPPLVAHESIHFQQKYPLQGGLLCNCLKEGSADFLGELSSGRLIKRMQETHVWANARERELWEEFQKDMPVANSTGRWLYGSSGGKDRPVDLGYWMGYKISEAHYKNSADKKQAVHDILIVKDCQQLLKASRYAEKFAASAPVQK